VFEVRSKNISSIVDTTPTQAGISFAGIAIAKDCVEKRLTWAHDGTPFFFCCILKASASLFRLARQHQLKRDFNHQTALSAQSHG